MKNILAAYAANELERFGWRKGPVPNKYMPHQGKKEIERRKRKERVK